MKCIVQHWTGDLRISNADIDCVGYLLDASEIQTLQSSVTTFSIDQLDPNLIVQSFGLGFFICVPVWVAIFGARRLFSLVK